MDYTFAHYQESADFLRARLGGFVPEVLMILGSGLGFLGDVVEDPIAVPYADIPHFKHSTAPGHKGRLVFGTLRGKRVAVMQGRMHHYEGYSYEETAYAVRVARLLGAQSLMVNSATGCVNTDWKAGEIMLITDQIKIFLDSPLRGPNLDQFGPRFPDATYLSTPAEVRFARLAGADAVGMSTAPEVTVASHCGMKVLGFALLANMAAGILDQPLTEEEVLEAGEAAKERFSALVLACLEDM